MKNEENKEKEETRTRRVGKERSAAPAALAVAVDFFNSRSEIRTERWLKINKTFGSARYLKKTKKKCKYRK